MTDWRSRFHLFPMFAVAITLFYYAPFLHNFFNFDDFKYLENMYRGWLEVAIGYGSLRLVSNLTWLPLFAIFGVDPFAYNLLAVILYAANAILLYFLLLKLLNDRSVCFLAASFFVASSVGADAVFWKATNSSLIALFFYLGTLRCYVNHRLTGEGKQYFRALSLFAFAIFSKEEAASLPFVAALIDVVFFDAWRDKRGLLRRIAPFCALIVCYLVANAVVFNYLLGSKAEPQTLYRLRPLYSLVGGGSAFFLSPDGHINANGLPVYLSALCVALSLFLKRSRRLLLFGYFWIFFAFLPQSLTGLGQFEPRVIVNSISRYLYITSIGAAIVFAVALDRLKDLLPLRLWHGIAGAVLLLFVCVHYPRVRQRGEQWRSDGAPVKEFLVALRQNMPRFPSPAFLYLEHRPTGSAFIQQALRAFYGNPQIYLVSDLANAPKTAIPLFFVDYRQAPVMPVLIDRLR